MVEKVVDASGRALELDRLRDDGTVGDAPAGVGAPDIAFADFDEDLEFAELDEEE